jgi:hypothetical protein
MTPPGAATRAAGSFAERSCPRSPSLSEPG